MTLQLVMSLEDKIKENHNNDSKKLLEIGNSLYGQVQEKLERDYYGKYVVIVIGAESADGRHKIMVTDPLVRGRRRLDIIDEVQQEYPNSIPYLRFIGNQKDNPAGVHIF